MSYKITRLINIPEEDQRPTHKEIVLLDEGLIYSTYNTVAEARAALEVMKKEAQARLDEAADELEELNELEIDADAQELEDIE